MGSTVPNMRQQMLTLDPSQPPQFGRLAVSASEAAQLVGLGRTTIYRALNAGALRSVKVGGRRLIRIDALDAWLRAHEGALQTPIVGPDDQDEAPPTPKPVARRPKTTRLLSRLRQERQS
ncbi:MAG: helix-turn-helix domain-containing protein [Pseudomonadota bacterium]